MFKWLGNLVDSNEKVLKRLQPVVDKINDLEPEYQKLTDDELKAKTQEFKGRLAKATLDIQQTITGKTRTVGQRTLESSERCSR